MWTALWFFFILPAMAGSDWGSRKSAAVDKVNASADALNAGDPDQARRLAEAALRKDPDFGFAKLMLAEALIRTDDVEGATALLETLTADFPSRPEVWTDLARARFVAQDFPAARDAAVRAIQLEPDSWVAHYRYMLVALRLGTSDEVLESADAHLPVASAACLKVMAATTQDELTIARQTMDDCALAPREQQQTACDWLCPKIGGCEGVCETGSRVAVERSVRIVEANEKYEGGDLDGALALYEAILAEQPDNIHVRLNLANVLIARDQPKPALEHLEQAFNSETWIRVSESGSYSGVVTEENLEEFTRLVDEGLAMYVQLLLSGSGTPQQAKRFRRQAEALTEDPAVLLRMDAILAVVGGDAREGAAQARLLAGRYPTSTHTAKTLLWLERQAPESIDSTLAEALQGAGHPHDRYNAAVAANNRGDHARCHRYLDGPPMGELQSTGDRLRWQCAIYSKSVEAAEAARGAVGAAGAPGLALNHARLLTGESRAEDALALLDEVAALDAPPEGLASARVSALLSLERLDDAVALSGETLDAITRANLGIALYNARRLEEAAVQLEQACPELPEEYRESCMSTLQSTR